MLLLDVNVFDERQQMRITLQRHQALQFVVVWLKAVNVRTLLQFGREFEVPDTGSSFLLTLVYFSVDYIRCPT